MLCDPFSVALFVCFLRGGGGGVTGLPKISFPASSVRVVRLLLIQWLLNVIMSLVCSISIVQL